MSNPVVRVENIRKLYGRTSRRLGRLLRGAAGRNLRPDRPQRRRKDDDDGVRRGVAVAGRRHDFGVWAEPGARRVPPAGADWRAAAGSAAAEAHQGLGSHRPVGVALFPSGRRHAAARAAWARREAGRLVHDAVWRAEAAFVHRIGAHQRSRAGVPGRTDDRPRSAGPPRHLGSGARHPPARQDGVHDDAPDGRGRAALRSRGRDRSRARSSTSIHPRRSCAVIVPNARSS